jgi:hypothetical protein
VVTCLLSPSAAFCRPSIDLSAGTFEFDPPLGVTGNATFTYADCDNGNPLRQPYTVPATVTATVSGLVIWFVDPASATKW